MTQVLWEAAGLLLLVLTAAEAFRSWLDARSTRIRITKDWPDA